ncbi:hypothetical protein Tco_0359200 [Tanacetum coccineum]
MLHPKSFPSYSSSRKTSYELYMTKLRDLSFFHVFGALCYPTNDSENLEDNHDLDVAHMNNDPFFGILIPENNSEASSSSDIIPTVVQDTAAIVQTQTHTLPMDQRSTLDNINHELEKTYFHKTPTP